MSTSKSRIATLAALAGATAALAIPGAANAAYTGAIDPVAKTVALTGDTAADNLIVGEATGNLTHNQPGFDSAQDFDSATAGTQTVPADATFTVTVNAGGGDDTVTFTTSQVVAAIINGGDGNDLLTGTDKADTLDGNAGNDRVVGARGNDTMRGGDGNDTLVWNNGDASDVMDGQAGADDIEVNGAATQGDVFTIAPGTAGRVRFDRTNLVPFFLDVGTSERMVVNGLGGSDTITGATGLAPLIALALNGGVGTDAITGGDGPDVITGGEEVDTLSGAGGNDRIVGDRGDDAMSGGDGDDTLVWNNGDNSDAMNGEAGSDTVEVNGASGAGDAFLTEPNAARTRFQRTNLVPFTLDIGTTEKLALNTLGGADTITNANGLALDVHVDAGSEDDTIDGGNGSEVLFGGSGNDTIDGDSGIDLIDGQAGNDTLRSRDGVQDQVRCGDGNDDATTDRRRLDQVAADCETVTRGNGPSVRIVDSRAAVVRIGGRALTRVRIACPSAAVGFCKGTLTLFSRPSAGRTPVVLGRSRFILAQGTAARIPVALRRLNTPLNVRAEVKATDLDGDLATSSTRLRLVRAGA